MARLSRRSRGRLEVSTLAFALSARAASWIVATRGTNDPFARLPWCARVRVIARHQGITRAGLALDAAAWVRAGRPRGATVGPSPVLVKLALRSLRSDLRLSCAVVRSRGWQRATESSPWVAGVLGAPTPLPGSVSPVRRSLVIDTPTADLLARELTRINGR